MKTLTTMLIALFPLIVSAQLDFGVNYWNVNCYNGNLLKNTATYAGYYTENNLNIDSRYRYPYSNQPNAIPSNANSLSGLPYSGLVIGTVHTVVYKRQGFPTGYYQIDIPGLDDIGYLRINGIDVWNFQACCHVHINVWKGNLDSTSTVEFEYVNYASGSALRMNFTVVPNIGLGIEFIPKGEEIKDGLVEFTVFPNPAIVGEPINVIGGSNIRVSDIYGVEQSLYGLASGRYIVSSNLNGVIENKILIVQ